jgi:low-density lipoprotein receptor-related protein 1 (alpha-2-macroglobulin receptor)
MICNSLFILFSGDTGGAIMSLPLKNFSRIQTVRKDLGVTIKDLTIFSRDRQVGSNPCGNKNGGCEDLCFWNGTRPNCICAHGKLGSNGKSCERKSKLNHLRRKARL